MKHVSLTCSLLAATALMLTIGATAPASAQVQTQTSVATTIETRETPVVPQGVITFDVAGFDATGNGALVKQSVGDQLFKLYDVDGNGVVDNIEYERRAIATVVPVERVTTISYDVTGNGIADQQETTRERLLRETLLSRFDQRKLGLSANELLDRSFYGSDIDGNKFISKKEWQGAYNAAIDRSNRIHGNLNR
jgi:hypothetical protein